MEDLCYGCNHMHLCVIRNKILKGLIIDCPCHKCIIKIRCSVPCPEFKYYFQHFYRSLNGEVK